MSGPIAGPIAPKPAPQEACTAPASARVSAAEEAHLAPPLRISPSRLDEIAARLQEHDWKVLNFVSGCRLATGRQLVIGLYLADRQSDPGKARVARRHLKRLSDWRILDPLPGRWIGGVRGGSDTLVYGVGTAGARLIARRGLRRSRLGRPGARYVDHTLACTQVAVDLRLAVAHRELDLIEIQHEPQCWRSYLGGLGERLTLKPDLFVRVARPGSAHEYRAMLEVDRATESDRTIRGKAERYLSHYRSGEELRHHAIHPRIVWTAPTPGRSSQLRHLLGGLPAPAGELFAVCLATELVQLLFSEAQP